MTATATTGSISLYSLHNALAAAAHDTKVRKIRAAKKRNRKKGLGAYLSPGPDPKWTV